jgi:hypothetical protein
MLLAAAITIYAAFAAEFLWRYFADLPVRKISSSEARTQANEEHTHGLEPAHGEKNGLHGPRVLTRRVKLMITGLVFSTTVIFIRCEGFMHASLGEPH